MPPPEDWYGRTIAVSAALFLGTLLVVSRAIGNEFGRSLRNRSSGCLDWSGDPPPSSRILCSFAVIRAQARGLTYPVVLRKIAWTTTRAREASHRPRGSHDKT